MTGCGATKAISAQQARMADIFFRIQSLQGSSEILSQFSKQVENFNKTMEIDLFFKADI
jgi:hypothetical protein